MVSLYRRKESSLARWLVFVILFGAVLVSVAVYLGFDEEESVEESGGGRRRIISHHSVGNSSVNAQAGVKSEAVVDKIVESKEDLAVDSGGSLRDDEAVMEVGRGGYYIIEREPVFREGVAASEVAAATATTYVVVSGDILGRIAERHGCSVAELQVANRLSGDGIKIGQKLLIPECGKGKVAPLVEEPVVVDVPRGRWWKRVGVNTKSLAGLMKAEGFVPPKQFMAFVLEISFDSTRQVIVKERAFDWNGSSSKRDGWNPASTVKLFAAIGALHRIDSLGFSSNATVVFHSKREYKTTVSKLIQDAIIQSDNIAYNRVAQLAGFESLHKEILTSKFGVFNTALNRGYQLKDWTAMGEDPSFRVSPSITLIEGSKKKTLSASHSKISVPCSASACTTLQDLGESTRRLMLQEQLPAEESYQLKTQDLIMLRRAMRSERSRGDEMIKIFEKEFKDSRVKFYSKPGFSEDWYTDNVYIFDPRSNQAWIVVMSGYPGRSSLNSASLAMARVISKGKLKSVE